MRSTRRQYAHTWAKHLAAAVSAALTLTLLQAAPALGDDDTREQRRPKTQDVPSTPVVEEGGEITPLKHLAGYGTSRTPKADWPEPGSATVALTGAGARGGIRAGGLPVSLAALKSRTGAPTRAKVDLLGHAAARKAGIDGLLLKVTRADGRRTVSGKVSLGVDYASFAQAYGGDWAQRLRLVQLPACALTTPKAAACRTVTPVATNNDVRSQRLTADVPAAVAGAKAPLLAVAAAPSGSSGAYTATSLAPSASWQVAAQTGAFTWQYPLRVPPAVAGPSPQLGLAYNSASTDGRTASSNNQTSWAGEGFDLSAGYIERAYRSCTDDGHDEAGAQKYDLCWHSDNATMNFGGRAGELVKKSADEWRLKQDDGTRVERRTGGFNSDDNKEYWVVTTTDGTRYFFGKGKRESEAADAENTGSSWEVPVFGDDKDEPCHKDTFKDSRCQQTWRWNLDYVVDVHGNSMTYYYGTETNKYDTVRGDKVVSYDRGGYLKRVEYGEQEGKENSTTAPAQVVFTTAERCTGAAADCEPGDLKESTATRWPDVPFDQICTSDTECKDQWSPTFFTRKRLSKVTTQTLGSDGKYADVDVWDLAHKYQSADTTHSPAMWLESVTHSGKGGANKLPKVTFYERQDANRVDTGADDRLPMYKWRIRAIQSETGGTISVNYKPTECTSATLPTPETNTKRCMPSFWSKEGTVGEKEDWFHKFVVDTVIEDEVTVTGPNKVTSYDYAGAAWAFDDSELVKTKKKTWNQWRGFRKVTVRTGDADSKQLRAETTYLQGMDGDREKESGGTKSVTVTASDGTKVRDDARHQGFQLEQRTFNGGEEIAGTVSTPWKSAATATEGADEATYAAVKSTKTRTALDDGKVRRASIEHFYDAYGMLERSSDSGDLADPDDDTCTTNTYNRNTDANLLTLLKRVTVVPVGCDDGPPSYKGEAISDVRTWYDDRDTYGTTPTEGDVVRSEKVKGYAADGTPQYVTTSTAKYDAHGRVVESADQAGVATKTSYTPTTGGPVTGMKVEDPAGNTTTSTVDPRWGLVTATVDANKQRTDLEYDALGRLLKVWLPGRAKATDTPSLEYAYLVRNNGPVVTTTKSLLPNGSVATSHQLSDGLLRARQTQTPAANSGRVLTTTEYDSRGLAVKEIGPFYNSAAVSTTFVGVADASEGTPRETETVYDGAGRPTDEIFRVAGAEKWRTKASYHGDHVTVDPPTGETPTATYSDAHGLKTKLLQFKGSSPTGGADTTTYSYDQADRLKEVKDEAGNVWSYDYDVRGRQTLARDPDTGTTRTTYNDLDQVRTTTDARGTTLTYNYDKLGRQRSLHNGATKLASWEYDSVTVPNGKGRLTSATRWIGADAYTTSVDSYDVAGRPTKTSITVPEAEGKLAGTYTATASYKPDGSLNTIDLPAAGDLPMETLTSGYTATGLPSFTLGDKADYARETRYSNYGEVLQLTLGTASSDKYTWLTNTYEEGTRRLERARIDREVVKTPDADLAYGYDDAGNIKRIADTPEGKAADVQCFTYDYLRRMTDAWTQTATACPASGGEAATGGPAPYWHSYGYDAAGNRTLETRHATGTTGTAAITQTTSYKPGGTDAKGGVHAHAMQSAEAHTVTSAKEVTAAQTFAYDESGNTVRRTKAATDLSPAVDQKLDWDDEGHLAAVTPYSSGNPDEAQKTGFVYDADGNRLIRKEKGAVTLYLGDQEIRLDTAKNTLAGTRYYTHGGQQIGVRTAAGVTWLVGGQNGTAEIAIKAADSAIVQRRTLPFGEVRGAKPATEAWPGDKAFVGGTADATGLIHLGAREYDPVAGRFVSADPALNFDDPQHLNAYAYGRNNPFIFPDPSGLYWGESWISPIGHGVLDVVGLVPGFGEPADLINGLWYTAEGNYIDAGLSYASAIPIAGYGATAAKGARYVNKAVDAVDTATDAAKAADKVKDAKKVADDVTPPTTPKPKPKPEPAPPAKAKDAPEVKKGDSGGKKGDGAGEKGNTGGKDAEPDAPEGSTCKVGNSFVPGTTVVMADGTEKPIEDIEPGDEVRATDPESGATEAKSVTAAITGHGVKKLVEVTVDTDGDRGDATATVTATDGHPFWVMDLNRWVDAKDLKPGQSLTTDKGVQIDVVAVRTTVHTATVHNLTVADIHTYLVEVGEVPVLVHNCGNMDKDQGVQGAHPRDHVGQSDRAIQDRAANDPAARGTASSLHAGTAQANVDAAVQANLSKINEWIRKQSTPVSARKEFTHDFGGTVIGRVADAAGVRDATKLTLVVMKINKGTGGHKGAWVLFTLKAS